MLYRSKQYQQTYETLVRFYGPSKIQEQSGFLGIASRKLPKIWVPGLAGPAWGAGCLAGRALGTQIPAPMFLLDLAFSNRLELKKHHLGINALAI